MSSSDFTRRASQPQRITSSSLLRASTLIAIGVILGLSLSPRIGRSAIAGTVKRAPEPEVCPTTPALAVAPRVVHTAASEVKPAPAQATAGCGALDAAHGQKTSRDLTDQLRKRTSIAERLVPSGDAQEVASHVLPYMQGMADALSQLGPEYAEDFAAEIDRALCDSETSEALKLVMVRLAATSSDLSTGRGYDCIFENAGTSPPILNTAIEAWRATGLPRSEALDQLAASDPEHRLRIEGAHQRMRMQENNLMADEIERNHP